ncbi:MAG: DUF285 domain-containing protein [Lactobacillaceae bacterium]|nr:DUF285 domain-containing protein [Lactobacillaceae bacterium]
MRWNKITKRIAKTLALLVVVVGGAVAPIAGVIIPGMQSTAHAANVSDTTYGSCTWNITDGTLNIRPTNNNSGTMPATGGTTPWESYDASIEKVNIAAGVIANADSSALFAELVNVTEYVGLINLNTENVVNMSYMFSENNSVQTFNLSNFHTESVTDMSWMFCDCFSLKAVNVLNFDTSSVTDMSCLFRSCVALEKLDLSSLTTSMETTMDEMFLSTDELWELKLGSTFIFSTYDTGLVNPPMEVNFDGMYVTNSDQWQEIGTGTAHNPNGTILDVMDIPANHNGQGVAHTYVWQGTWADNTLVDYTVEPSYTITIPVSITISNVNGKGNGDVVLGAYPKLPYEDSLITIGVTSAAWELTNDHDTTGVAYLFGTDEGYDDLSTGDTFEFTADGEDDEPQVQTVYATLPSGSQFKYAETYTDTVNYTISTGSPEE